MVSLVRKVKNGTFLPDTPVTNTPDAEPIPAERIPELRELFLAQQEAKDAPSLHAPSRYNINNSMRNGWAFVQANQVAIIYSGVFLILSVLASALVSRLPVLSFLLSFTFTYFFFAGYFYIILKLTRGQVFEFSDIMGVISKNPGKLLLAAFVTSIPFGIGTILLIVPGLVILSLYIFTPLLICEKEMGFWEAMEGSRKKTLSMGAHNIGTLLGLMIINFLAILCFLVPVLVTLPMTLHAIAEMYDEQFSD